MDAAHPTSSLQRRLSAGVGATFERTLTAEAAEIAERFFELRPTAVIRVATERDDTFRLTVDGDPHGFLLKISPPDDDPGLIALQCAAIEHASRRDATLPLQRLVPPIVALPLHNGRSMRLMHYLPGRLLVEVGAPPTGLRSIGRMLGRLTEALDDFVHPAADRWLAWDLAHLGELSELLPAIEGRDRRLVVASVLEELAGETLPALRTTPRRVVHNDFHGANLVADQSAPGFITGILDFGDVVSSHRAADLAIAMSYAGAYARVTDDPWTPAFTLASGYREVTELSAEEVTLLPALVLGRLAQRLLLGSWLASTRPENADYTGRNLASAWEQLRTLRENPPRRETLSPSERVDQ